MSRLHEVLIVDDDPRIRALLRRCIETFGLRVRTTEASDAREARRALHTRMPRLVVLDWQLADSLGTELAQEIAADPSLHDTRVLGISGAGQPGINEKFFSRGASEFLQKPFSPREFVDSVSRLLA
ncbi:MAG: response regulator [Elusimicrobia bacterium]|nr:response regulator [Elusimicrobiota bacterium]